MIYSINGKIYLKMDNYYAEVEVKEGRLVPVKDRKKLYFTEVDTKKIKEYSVEEYLKNNPKGKELDPKQLSD